MAPKGDGTSVNIMAHWCATDMYHSIVIHCIQTFQCKNAVLSYLTCTFIITDALAPNGDVTSVNIMTHLCITGICNVLIYRCFNIQVPYLSYLTCTFIITGAMVPNVDRTSAILMAHTCTTIYTTV